MNFWNIDRIFLNRAGMSWQPSMARTLRPSLRPAAISASVLSDYIRTSAILCNVFKNVLHSLRSLNAP